MMIYVYNTVYLIVVAAINLFEFEFETTSPSLLIESRLTPCKTIIVKKLCHDDVIEWTHFPRYWPFVREIHR